MSQISWYPNFQPTSYFGGILRAILGQGGGKFRSSWQNYMPIKQGTILVDTSPGSLMQVASSVPHLNTVISTGAELFSMMQVKHVDKNGDEIKNSLVLKFLDRPNPIQSLRQYLYEFYILNGVYSKTFQHKIQGLSFDKIPKAMWLLPSGWMKINLTGKMYRQTDINEIIQSYEMVSGSTEGTSEPFEVEKIIYMSEGVGNNPLNPVSRIEALQIPLSNIMASLKSFNVIVSERGMIGFLSPDGDNKDSEGMLPFDEGELKKLRLKYQDQYNLDSQGGHVSMTHAKTKWVPMTFPVRDLMLTEGEESAFAAICAAYRHDRDLYPSTKGATFENKAAGMRSTIQNALQPLADKLMETYTDAFIESKNGERLIACYDHLPCMKEDERLAAQGQLYKAQAGEILLNNGVIDHDGFALMVGVEMTGDQVIIQRSQPTNQNTDAQ